MRLTPKWTATTEEAFGSSGKKGRVGELFVINTIRSWGWEVIDTESEKSLQLQGVDIIIKKPTWQNYYSVDVKNNMTDDGSFFIETAPDGWLFNKNKRSDRIWHCNPDTGWMAWYDRQRMQSFLITHRKFNIGILKINRFHKISFLTRSRGTTYE